MKTWRIAVAFACGLLFAVGLGLAGMTMPSKVLGFLDVAGSWDPSLACVMGGAVLVGLVLTPWILRRSAPVLDTRFHLPRFTVVDGRLIAGAALFGLGWGLGGICPGPAWVALATGAPAMVVFLVAMIGGMALYETALRAATEADAAPVERNTTP